MIKNERQYRITKAQAEKFERALARLSAPEAGVGPEDPPLRQMQREALQSQLDELRQELAEYEALRSGRRQVPDLAPYMDLPRLLIRRRIAAGLSQKDLADRIGLKEQQVQRYEATEYEAASFARLREVMRALDMRPTDDGVAGNADISLATLFARLQDIGFDRTFAAARLIPRQLLAQIEAAGEAGSETRGLVLRAANAVGRVLRITPSALVGTEAPRLDMRPALGGARFKAPAQVDEARMSAYTVYAHYLALLLLEATRHLPAHPIPTDWRAVREGILGLYGQLGFEQVLRYLWDCGVPVLPLRDAGAFHGACWRVEGRNVIVLKQRTRSAARWAFDGLHEFRHAGEAPELTSFAVIEVDEQDQASLLQQDEQMASQFAGNVLLDGRAEELAHRCAQDARGQIPRLKSVVPRVAEREGVHADALANYMAYRLAMEGQNWWGAATALQAEGADAWAIARDLLLERAELGRLNEVDRAILTQAITGDQG